MDFQSVLRQNVNEPPFSAAALDASGFVLLSDAVPDVIQEIRYYSTFNFVGTRITGYLEPVALLSREAAQALKTASSMAIAKGYRLKVYDAYRPLPAVRHFLRWVNDLGDTRMKAFFYPELDKTRIVGDYISTRSSHCRGSAIDLSLFDCMLGREVDMGGAFDYFGELSHPDYTQGLTKEQIDNRMLLRGIMLNCGFRPLDTEWWHFRLEKEPYPDTYFAFPVSADSVKRPLE